MYSSNWILSGMFQQCMRWPGNTAGHVTGNVYPWLGVSGLPGVCVELSTLHCWHAIDAFSDPEIRDVRALEN